MTNDTPRVLAVHPGALGDVVLFGRLMEQLDGRATLIAGSQKARLLEQLGVVEASMDFDALPISEIFADTPLEQCTLPARLDEHDVLVSCYADGASRAGQRLAGAARVERSSFLPIRPPEGFDGHCLSLWAHLLGLGPPSLEMPAWNVPAELRHAGRATLQAVGADPAAGAVVLHPGSGSPAKNWPIERYVTLAGELIGRGRTVCWSLGPVEREQGLDEALRDLGAPGAVLPVLTLPELAGVLSASGAVVGNDSGVCHLSAAVGARTVTLFGPASSSKHFQPIGPRVSVLEDEPLSAITSADVIDHLQ